MQTYIAPKAVSSFSTLEKILAGKPKLKLCKYLKILSNSNGED